MKIAWCPQHRGVMRISFFNPPTKHFGSPCPRCGNKLIEQERGKYESEVSVEEENLIEKPLPVLGWGGDVYHHNEEICAEDHTGEIFYEGSWVFPDEVPTKAPRPLCECCEFFKVQPDYTSYCTWCIDCPIEACDIPRSKLRRG